ncbi:MAG TPA: hypothetical protein VKZ89_05835 [Thermobifida alba]|nr:hypothetical protein [Thermobifida alba]
MHLSIVPPPAACETTCDVGFLAYVLTRTESELHTGADHETPEERAARQAAAVDIVDDLAAEYAADLDADPAAWFEALGGWAA